MKISTLRLHKPVVLLFISIFAFLLSVSTLLMTSRMSYPTIRSDGKGYYLYLPAAFIYHDLTMQWTKPFQQVEPPDISGQWNGLMPSADRQRTGVYLDKYTAGVAALNLPFFLAGHAMAHLTHHKADGFSGWYQVAIASGAAFYASAGCVILYLFLRRYFSARVSLGTVLSLLLGTNLLSYATYDASFSHVYSLFLMAALLYLTPKWYSSMSYRRSILLGAVAGLIVLVRPVNVIFMVLPLLWSIHSLPQLQTRLILFWRQWRKLALVAGAALTVLSPQLLYWHFITGKWLVFSYRGESFHLLHPQIINILFSADRGALFWAPILLLAVIGLVWLRRGSHKEWLVSCAVFLPLWLWVTSSWHSWQYGISYGHRAFIDIFPLLAIPIAAVYARCTSRLARWLVFGAATICVLANLFLMYLYWELAVPGAGTSVKLYLHIWHNGFTYLMTTGLRSGYIGLLGIAAVTLGPLIHYFLSQKNINQLDSATPRRA